MFFFFLVQYFPSFQVSRQITINLKCPNTGQTFPIQTNEHIALECGNLIQNLIDGDQNRTEYELRIPDVQCMDLLYMFLRNGHVTIILF